MIKKTLKVLLIVTASLAILLIGGRWIAFWQIEKGLIAQIETLRKSGVTLTYKDLNVNPWAGSLRLSGIVVQDSGEDSLCHSSAVVTEIAAEGIRLLPLLMNHKLVVESVVALKPHITYAKDRKHPQEGKSTPGFLHGIEVLNLRIDSGAIASFSVKQLSYSLAERSIRVDSVRMVPTLDRVAFARQSMHQTDQIHCTIPRIDMTGVTISESLPVNLAIHNMDLGFRLGVYRDKRFPSAHRAPSMLPVTFMQKLPFSLVIDSLNLSSSNVTYEELPQTGGIAGAISFDELVATITNIATDSIGESAMQVSARFMDAGQLDARFVFPMEPGKPNTVQATLSDFSMPSINRMLLPLASLEIQSGELQSLQLAFQYDDQQATGELDLRYTNLKVHSINHNQKRSTNKLVTLLINTMVQNNMDRTDQKDKRTGKIHWKRDPQAGLPSYWWKAILSGLRSVYSLDKVLSF